MKIIHHRGHTNLFFSNSITIDKKKLSLCLEEDIFIIDKNLTENFYKFFDIRKDDISNFYPVKASEEQKDIAKVSKLIELILKNNNTPKRIITFGGGILQDISGLCAALIRRGIEWVYVPTTLLSMADSCIGSKISINVNSAKNQVGLFYAPKSIYISPKLLEKLPTEQYLSGAGDILHYALQNNVINKTFMETLPSLFNEFNSANILEVVKETLLVKKKFAESDEFDQTTRRALNLGHSFGHAIELASSYAIPHGIAVIIGCSLAFKYSIKNKYLDPNFFGDHIKLINKLLLKSKEYLYKKYIDIDLLKIGLMKDKKNKSSEKINLVLPFGIELEKYIVIQHEEKNEDVFFNLTKVIINSYFDLNSILL